MEFPTIKFVYFALITLTISWLLYQRRTVQKTFLLAASYYFAWQWKPLFLVVIVFSSLMNFGFGKALHQMKGHPRRKIVLTVGVVANLGLLGFFKYYGFFIDNLQNLTDLLGLSVHLPLLEILIPFAISFYTFQGIAYLVDTYKDEAVQPETLLDFLLFISFFPQLGAGPICRSHELLPQLHAEAPKRVPDISQAVTMIATGLFKKMIVATYLASHMTTDAFLFPKNWSSLELIVATYAYTAQVYLDFSGYTDLARGIGLLFGFKIPENFNYPYRATDIGDFWRRWHITFSTWLRFYIYFPLGGSRKGPWRTYINLMITFLACGIWHGASWGYIIWGGMHGIALSLYKASLDVRRAYGLKAKGPWPIWWQACGWFATISFCAWARVFFKTPDLSTAFDYYRVAFSFTTHGAGLDLGVLFLTLLTIFLNFYGRPIFNAFVNLHERIPTPARPLAWAAMMVALFTLKPFGMAATIYFSF